MVKYGSKHLDEGFRAILSGNAIFPFLEHANDFQVDIAMHHRPKADSHCICIDIASGAQLVDLIANQIINSIFADAHLITFMVYDVISP